MSYVTFDHVKAAAARISCEINYTNMHYSRTISEMTSNNVFMKPENFQRTGAFKIRGALNKLKYMQEQGELLNVVTASSGNHGQALALAASLMGVKSKIVVPESGSQAKLSAIEAYGGELVPVEWDHIVRRERASEISKESDFQLVSSHDEREIIAGQGTIAIEMLEQHPDLDVIIVPVGGGGLISGIATAAKNLKPDIKIYGVEPELSPSMKKSLEADKRVRIPVSDSIADGIRSPIPGKNTFPIVKRYVEDVLLASEQEIMAAVAFLLERAKMVVEPSGAVSLAAVLFQKIPERNKKIGVVLSGGNVTLETIGDIAYHGYASLL